MFNAIPIYDGEDPDKFEPWLEQLQNACRVGKHDIREVAMCCASGPVLEVLQSMDPWILFVLNLAFGVLDVCKPVCK